MKSTSLLLAVSLLGNAGLVACLALRPAAPAPAVTAAGPAPKNAPANIAGRADALRAALTAGDIAALEAAGLPPELARDAALGRILARLAEQARAARGKNSADLWWRNRSGAARDPQLAARRELANALHAAFGDDFGLGGTEAGQLAFLAPEKRDALRRILQDYDEMMTKFGASGLQLPSDKEKLRLLKAERDRDIAALLTPDERLAYELRTSPTALGIRSRYGDAIESEEDFRKVYALQRAFDDKFPPESLTGRITPETLRPRAEAQQQLRDDLRAALGDEKYAALRRATDGDLRNVDSLASRLNLPSDTTDRIAAARETFAAESQRINADAALTPPQRRTQLQDLAARAKNDVVRTLGGEAGEAYAQSSPWLSMLQNGMAYSTAPQPGSPGAMVLDRGIGAGVFPVLPAGATMGGVRQVVSSGTPGGGDAVRTSDHVMTFTSSVSDGSAAPAERKPIIIAAPPSEPAPQPKP